MGHLHASSLIGHLLPSSIRGRLLLLLAAAVVPVLGILAVIYTQRYQERRRQESQANLEIARAVGRAFDAFVDSVSWHEHALGGALVGLTPYTQERANHLLAASANEYPAVDQIHWLSARGRVLASSDLRVGADVSGTALFRPVRPGQTFVGDLDRVGDGGPWRFAILTGIAGPRGKLAGIVVARVVPEQLGEVGLAIRRGDGGGVSVVDRAGRLAYRYTPQGPYAVGEDWASLYATLRRALHGRETVEAIADASMGGQRRIVALVPVPSCGWVAGAGRSEERALSAIRRDLTRDVALILLVDALALLAAVGIARGITRPVRRLEADAARLGAGDLAHRAAAAAPAEVGRLAAALNSMAARLQEQNDRARQSEAQAQEHAARLQAIFDAAPGIIWTAHDAACRSITGNRAAYDVLRVREGDALARTGLTPERLSHYRLFMDGVELAPDEMPIQRVAASGQAILGCALDLHFEDGTVRSLLGNVVPVLDPEANPTGAIAAFVDVTALRETERALDEAHRRLRFHVENTPLGVVETDSAFVITRWAAQAESILGWPADDVVGRRIDDVPFIHPDDLPRVREMLAAMARGGKSSNITRNRNVTKDGRVIQCEWYNSATAGDEGRVSSLFSLVQDVTERTALQAALKERAAEIATIMDVAPVAIWVAQDPDCRVITGNAYADERVMGIPRGGNISRSALPGRAAVSYRVFRGGVELTPEQLPAQVAAATGHPTGDTEVEVRFEDGRVVALILAAAPLFAVDGRVRGSVLTGLDVTHLRQAREEAEQRGAEAEVLNVRLQRAMAETHHRVKNNLQTIAALIDMQGIESSGTVPASELERLGRHVRGLATIHDLLTKEARANGGAEFLNAREALEKLKPLLDGMVGGRELRFRVEDVHLPVRQGTALAVLVNELVSNAVKHGDGAIELSLAVVESRASLQVRDHGRGFPEGFAAQSAANTGLDLVQSVGGWDLQGELEFANAPDGGACVTVRFPVAEQNDEG